LTSTASPAIDAQQESGHEDNSGIIGLGTERFLLPRKRFGKGAGVFFSNAYSRPSEMVDGINDGARLNISRSNNAAAQRYHAGAASDFRHSR
jgi:hypothetical protein